MKNGQRLFSALFPGIPVDSVKVALELGVANHGTGMRAHV